MKITPEIRAATREAIRVELARARNLYPTSDKNLEVLQHFAEALGVHMRMSRGTVGDMITIRTDAISLAVMAIRIIEEGSTGYAYLPDGRKPDAAQVDLFAMYPSVAGQICPNCLRPGNHAHERDMGVDSKGVYSCAPHPSVLDKS